mmetsp:Transcript_13788/g.49464  ORF Transcript_13788/g.49464 Transcript_13788/m.49464 type:complete len:408 (-) Transcript_13788:416-1639(-)
MPPLLREDDAHRRARLLRGHFELQVQPLPFRDLPGDDVPEPRGDELASAVLAAASLRAATLAQSVARRARLDARASSRRVAVRGAQKRPERRRGPPRAHDEVRRLLHVQIVVVHADVVRPRRERDSFVVKILARPEPVHVRVQLKVVDARRLAKLPRGLHEHHRVPGRARHLDDERGRRRADVDRVQRPLRSIRAPDSRRAVPQRRHRALAPDVPVPIVTRARAVVVRRVVAVRARVLGRDAPGIAVHPPARPATPRRHRRAAIPPRRAERPRARRLRRRDARRLQIVPQRPRRPPIEVVHAYVEQARFQRVRDARRGARAAVPVTVLRALRRARSQVDRHVHVRAVVLEPVLVRVRVRGRVEFPDARRRVPRRRRVRAVPHREQRVRFARHGRVLARGDVHALGVP